MPLHVGLYIAGLLASFNYRGRSSFKRSVFYLYSCGGGVACVCVVSLRVV